jgi:NAD(P)-dependent dehydrogenase (short-subunit alcohol dehydrogenase family)
LIEDFNVKYVGALRCARAVIPFMKTAGWGRIINISGGNARNAGNLSGGGLTAPPQGVLEIWRSPLCSRNEAITRRPRQ